jgi:hypothetical protein
MLQVQTRKPARTFNRYANIRTDTLTPHSMMTRVMTASFQPLCNACGPLAIFVTSDLEVISANALALRHFGGARPTLGRLPQGRYSARSPMAHGSEPTRPSGAKRKMEGSGTRPSCPGRAPWKRSC